MSELEQLGSQFRRRRQELGATQLDVARTVGVTRQWLVRVESGTGNPDLRQLLRLCEVLDISLTVAPHQGPREGTGRAAQPAAGLTTDLDQLLRRHTGAGH